MVKWSYREAQADWLQRKFDNSFDLVYVWESCAMSKGSVSAFMTDILEKSFKGVDAWGGAYNSLVMVRNGCAIRSLRQSSTLLSVEMAHQ